MYEVCGLYQSKTAKGDPYLGGNLGRHRLMVFRNKFKRTGDEGKNDPDFYLYVDERRGDGTRSAD